VADKCTGKKDEEEDNTRDGLQCIEEKLRKADVTTDEI